MPSNGDSNLDRLRDAGLVMQEPLPEAFVSFVDGLTPDEVRGRSFIQIVEARAADPPPPR